MFLADCWDAGGWQDTLLFVWDHAGTKVEANVTACGPLVQAHAPFTFTRTGSFTVGECGVLCNVAWKPNRSLEVGAEFP